MQSLLEFLNNERVLVLATHTQDPTPHPWVTNVYFVADENPHIYFFGGSSAKWSQDIQQNPDVAFSLAWSHPEDIHVRKGVQGIGQAEVADLDQHLETALAMYHSKFPKAAEVVSADVVRAGDSSLFILKPKFLKYWDDGAEERVRVFEF